MEVPLVDLDVLETEGFCIFVYLLESPVRVLFEATPEVGFLLSA